MKKSLLLTLIITSSFAYSQGVWKSKGNSGGQARKTANTFSINNFGYVCMGQSATGSCFNDLWQYNPVLNSWSQKAFFPGIPRCDAATFCIGNYGYIGTGQETTTNTILKDFWEYDAVNNVWNQKPNFPGAARFAAIGFSIGNKGYMGIGYNYIDFWEYDQVANTWNRMPDYLGYGREQCIGFSIGTKGYVGFGSNPCNTSYNDFWEFDPVTKNWTPLSNFPGLGRQVPINFVVCNYAYVGAGDRCNKSYSTDFYQYDPASDTWTPDATFPGIGRDDPFSFSIGNKGYGGTGEINGTYLNDFWEFSCGNIPVSSFEPSDSTLCMEGGGCINFFDHSTGNPTSWKWLFPGAIPDSSILQNPNNICYNNSGTYAVTLIVSNNNGSDTLTISPTISVGGTPPAPVITIIGGDTLVCSNASAYQWFYNGAPIPSATDSFYVATHGGLYNVQITDNIGCSRLGTNVFVSSVNEIGHAPGFVIYPNPTHAQFIISNLQFPIESIEVFNVMGESLNPTLTLPKREGVVSFNLDASAGIYFVRVRNKEGQRVEKVMVE